MSDIDISPEAVEQLAHHDDIGGDALRFAPTLRALSAALTQSRAETAAVIERAAKLFDDGTNVTCAAIGRCIRAIATPDQSSALAAIEAAAEARGMRKAAVIAYQFEGNDKLRCAILAAIPQKDAPND